MVDLRAALLAQYVARGIVNENGEGLPLHVHCPSAQSCWSTLGAQHRPAAPFGGVSLPWIGPGYAPGGVLLVGINMNEHGGLGAWEGLIRGALADLPHKDRLYASDTYAGSMFQQRAGWYAAVILRHLGVAEFQDGHPVLDWHHHPSRNTRICQAWERLAATNQVKCSPLVSPETPKSRPTEGMWANCAPLWLALELEVLRPSVLLVLGLGENLTQLGRIGSMEGRRVCQGIFRGTVQSRTGHLEIVGVTHPAAFGGCSKALVTRLDDSLRAHPLQKREDAAPAE